MENKKSPTEKEKKDLEQTLQEKVMPLLEQSMERNLGISIPKIESDITDRIKQSALHVYFPLDSTFQEAKKIFKSEFLKRELKIHSGNISQLAKNLGLDRRSVHRAIKGLEINLDDIREKEHSPEKYQQEIVNQAIKGALDQYKEILQPQKIEQFYRDVPSLSRNIARFIPHRDHTWKQAEQEFEKQFLEHALQENNWNISKTATSIDIRVETLHRKIKKLGLKK